MSVGLTGSVASGKSSVARIWREAGVPVVSADDLSRQAVAPESRGLARIREAFGDEVLTPEGALDRDAMRERVFRHPDERRRLERILHPRIRELRNRWLAERGEEGHPLVAVEIPLLFETGTEDDFDVVVVVHASRDERLRRLVAERGLEEDEARRIMEAQIDPDEKRRRADEVLLNDGDRDELREGALALLERLRRAAAGTGPT